MKKRHKIISWVIGLSITWAAYCFNFRMLEVTAQNLITFFSVVFGFYMTSVAIFYNSSYAKDLYKFIDRKEQKRGVHILRDYLLFSGGWLIFSISIITVFTMISTKNHSGVLYTGFPSFKIPFIDYFVDINLLLTSILFGIASINIFCIFLMMRMVINGMIEESRRS